MAKHPWISSLQVGSLLNFEANPYNVMERSVVVVYILDSNTNPTS